MRAAYATFSGAFAGDAAHLDLAVFSADGDLLHEFFDCLFLGPYNRVDLRACDAEVSCGRCRRCIAWRKTARGSGAAERR